MKLKKTKPKIQKTKLKWINFAALTIAGIINAFGVTIFLYPVNLYDSGISGTSGRIRNTCDGAAASDGFAIPGTTAEKDRVAAEKQVLDWLEQ